MKRLPHALLVLLGTSIVSLAGCANGGSGNGDDDAVDARSIDALTPDGASPDASSPDASSPDAAPDAALDAMPLTGETCQMADLITIAGGVGNATVTGTTAGYTNHYMPPAACTSDYLQDGPDHVYEISVPAGQRLTAGVTPGAGYDAGIYLVRGPATGCDANPIVCLAGNDDGGTAVLDSVHFDNVTDAAVSVFIVIDGTSTTGGAYSLAVTVGAPPPPTPGDDCTHADAITLTAGAGSATGSTTTANGYANDYVPDVGTCTDGDGNDHVYSVTVPAGQRLAASVTPTTSGFDPSLYLVTGPAAACTASPTCVAGTDNGGSDDLERLTYTNATANPVEVFVVVDSYSATEEGDFMLSVFVGTPAGDTCALADTVTLTAGMATIAGTTRTAAGYADDYVPPAACTSTYTQDGNDHAYTVSVPMGQTLTATVTPTGYDAGIYLIAGPAASCNANPIVCLAGIDGGSSGAPESVTYMNTTGAAVDVMIVVDSYDPTAEGDYSLAVRVQ